MVDTTQTQVPNDFLTRIGGQIPICSLAPPERRALCVIGMILIVVGLIGAVYWWLTFNKEKEEEENK